MTAKRPTKREMFTALIDYLSVAPALMDTGLEGVDPEQFLEDAIAFCKNEIALLDKKHNAKKTPTKTQLENAGIKEDIVDTLIDNGAGMRATEVASVVGFSVQKVSALLRQLVKDGRVDRVEDGKVVTFVGKG